MSDKTVLVIGGGGREHALAWALARSPQVGQVYVAPGNAGTAWEAGTPDPLGGAPLAPAERVRLAPDAISALAAFAHDHAVDVTVVGPEGPLAAGIADTFRREALAIFGPSQQAARIESSKAFARNFMARHGIPSPAFAAFTEREEAIAFVHEQGGPQVVKASGLAAGKGVIVCDDADEAEAAIERIMGVREVGEAGDTVVIEERLSGREASLLAFSDGENVVPMLPTRDHKRAYDGGLGPNTGGMGAYAPTLDLTQDDIGMLTETVLKPTVQGLRDDGTPYVGVLFAGLMLTDGGPRVLEFNCRFGAPETQAILPLLTTDLYPIIEACVNGELADDLVGWQRGSCAIVILASQGYPRKYPTGLPIDGLDELPADVIAFHAGTERTEEGRLITAGGRVLGITGSGVELSDALRKVYGAIEHVSFQGMQYRRDIGVNYIS
ncbi:MAG: phosphoribosylamine--glycine ligase [Anaerolineae bacterium]